LSSNPSKFLARKFKETSFLDLCSASIWQSQTLTPIGYLVCLKSGADFVSFASSAEEANYTHPALGRQHLEHKKVQVIA
jgi:hypothetical protein